MGGQDGGTRGAYGRTGPHTAIGRMHWYVHTPYEGVSGGRLVQGAARERGSNARTVRIQARGARGEVRSDSTRGRYARKEHRGEG